MNYEQLTFDIIERCPGTNDEEEIKKFLINEYENIKVIKDYVIETPMYKDNLEKTNSYLEETKDYSLTDRWKSFLIKIISAPLSLMITGTIIFYIPMIEEEIRKIKKNEKPNFVK